MTTWVRSSFAPKVGPVLEVGITNGMATIRDAELPDQAITISASAFSAFVAGIKAGEFDDLIPEPDGVGKLPGPPRIDPAMQAQAMMLLGSGVWRPDAFKDDPGEVQDTKGSSGD